MKRSIIALFIAAFGFVFSANAQREYNQYPQQNGGYDNRGQQQYGNNNGNYDRDQRYSQQDYSRYGAYDLDHQNPYDYRSRAYTSCQSNRRNNYSTNYPIDPRNPYDIRNQQQGGYGYNNQARVVVVPPPVVVYPQNGHRHHHGGRW
jgi:hypothetical protein